MKDPDGAFSITDAQLAELQAEAEQLDTAAFAASRAAGFTGQNRHFVTRLYCALARGFSTSPVTTPEQARARCAKIYNERANARGAVSP